MVAVAGYYMGRADEEIKQLKKERGAKKKNPDFPDTMTFEYSKPPDMFYGKQLNIGGVFNPSEAYAEFTNNQGESRMFPIFSQPIEAAIPKELWMPQVGQIPTEQLEKMLDSATEQELYEISAFIKKELDRRKTPAT